MQRLKIFFRSMLQLGVLAGLIVALAFLFRSMANNSQPAAQIETTELAPYPILDEGSSSPEEKSPYPPPVQEAAYPPPDGLDAQTVPENVKALASQKTLFENVTAVTLGGGKIWLVPPDRRIKRVTDVDDAAMIFGWNHNGTKLLYGRGLYPTGPEMANSTELWVYDFESDKNFRVVDGTRVWAASWSPVDDRIAYCEYGDPPIIYLLSENGDVQLKRENLYPDFTWSPDGSAIAVVHSGPEHTEFDTKFSVLALWRLEKDDLQLISQATRESHTHPIWQIDGRHIIFTRVFGPGSEDGKSGLYNVNTTTMQIEPINQGPEYIVHRMTRSPRSDTLIYVMGYDVYVMEYGKTPVLIGNGEKPVWLPDGKTVLYLNQTGIIQSVILDSDRMEKPLGGGSNASTIHLQPDIFFFWGLDK